VSLREVDHGLNPSIQDDFIGFDTAEVRKKPGLGLSNMSERVRIIEGDLRIMSEPERSTTTEVNVPLKRGTNMTET
jgi:signal transduction histidine kinase